MKVIINDSIMMEVTESSLSLLESITNIKREYKNGEYVNEIDKTPVDIKFVKGVLDADNADDAVSLLIQERKNIEEKNKNISEKNLKIEKLEAFEKYRTNKGFSHKQIKDAINSIEYSWDLNTWEKIKERIKKNESSN